MSTEVPPKAHWEAFSGMPVAFEPEKVWTYTIKLYNAEHIVSGWRCIWCLSAYKGFNATKALHHQAGVGGKEINLCLPASNGDQPAWYTKALRALISQQNVAKKDKIQVRICIHASVFFIAISNHDHRVNLSAPMAES